MADSQSHRIGGTVWTVVRIFISLGALFAAGVTLQQASLQVRDNTGTSVSASTPISLASVQTSRRLSTSDEHDHIESLHSELAAREKLFDDAAPEEVKYWFEYAGPLQKYFYRYSKSRKKADSFEGRDDSGVISSRFVPRPGGGEDYEKINLSNLNTKTGIRFKQNCAAFGAYDSDSSGVRYIENYDKCRVLFSINTVGAGAGSTILWETQPPRSYVDELAKPWISEQATAATHLERGLAEVNAMCATGAIDARVQVLVCEPIPEAWTDWMEQQLSACKNTNGAGENDIPLQVVVMSSPNTAETCHDLKSGFIEKKQQNLILAPPFLTQTEGAKDNPDKSKESGIDPSVKTTHPDLLSSDNYDLYVAVKWSSLITLRNIFAFSQASADLAVAASSTGKFEHSESPLPNSSLLVPSFVRVSYVSEENNKVAKWRMHGDFFHPAAWEVCKDSYETGWFPDSLSSGGVNKVCKKDATSNLQCGQWWLFMKEEQMPTSPEIYAFDESPPVVFGGSNYAWMLTEQQRKEIVKYEVCKHSLGDRVEDEAVKSSCGSQAQGVIPLGDMESFLVNFMPNTALGKMHVKGKRPGYTRPEMTDEERAELRERKQLKGQKDIEKALFDYNIYPAALMHKDATLKAARYRDSKDEEPMKIKSGYYDVTITKPRTAIWGWCQAMVRRGLCTLHAEFLREEERCLESCGMRLDFSSVDS